MVIVRDLVLASVGAEVGAEDEAVLDEHVERAVDRRAVERRAGCSDRELDAAAERCPPSACASTSQISERCLVCRRATRLGALGSPPTTLSSAPCSAPQRSSMRRVFQRMTENAQVTTKRPTTT